MVEKITKEIDFSKRRDLYNSTNRLQMSLKRVNELPNPDKDDLLAHVQHLLDERRAKQTIIRNISSLTTFREKLGISFRNATATDLIRDHIGIGSRKINNPEFISVDNVNQIIKRIATAKLDSHNMAPNNRLKGFYYDTMRKSGIDKKEMRLMDHKVDEDDKFSDLRESKEYRDKLLAKFLEIYEKYKLTKENVQLKEQQKEQPDAATLMELFRHSKLQFQFDKVHKEEKSGFFVRHGLRFNMMHNVTILWKE